MPGSLVFKDIECMEKKWEKEPESVEWTQGEMPSGSQREKCFLEGVEERSPAKNLMGHKQKGGTGRLESDWDKNWSKAAQDFLWSNSWQWN